MNHKWTRSGLSLVETMVGVALLTMVTMSATQAITFFWEQNTEHQQTITAQHLAAECVELLRNVRDSAVKQYFPWDCGWSDLSQEGNKENAGRITPLSTTFDTESEYARECQKSFGVSIDFKNPDTEPEKFRLYRSKGADEQKNLYVAAPDTTQDFHPTPFSRKFSLELPASPAASSTDSSTSAGGSTSTSLAPSTSVTSTDPAKLTCTVWWEDGEVSVPFVLTNWSQE